MKSIFYNYWQIEKKCIFQKCIVNIKINARAGNVIKALSNHAKIL